MSRGVSSTAGAESEASDAPSGGVVCMRGVNRAGRDATLNCGARATHRDTDRPENAVREDRAVLQGAVNAGEFMVAVVEELLELLSFVQSGDETNNEDPRTRTILELRAHGGVDDVDGCLDLASPRGPGRFHSSLKPELRYGPKCPISHVHLDF